MLALLQNKSQMLFVQLSEFKAAYLHIYLYTSSNYQKILTVFPLLLSASFPPCLIFAWLNMGNVLVEFILSFKKGDRKKGIKSNKANS